MLHDRRIVSALALVATLSLTGCAFFQSQPDSTDANQVALFIALRHGARIGCAEIAKQHPAEAAIAAKAVQETVLPLLAGDRPELDAAAAALMSSLKGMDPALVADLTSDVEDLLALVPPPEQDTVLALALTTVATSCQRGLSALPGA